MGVIALIVGSVGLFVGGFAAWYTLWHRSVGGAFEKIPVAAGRTAHVVREGAVGQGRSA